MQKPRKSVEWSDCTLRLSGLRIGRVALPLGRG
jgi:hypothetical protein